MIGKILTLTFALTMSATASGAVADTVGIVSVDMSPITVRIAAHESLLWRLTPQSYLNPAIKQWMLPMNYSTLSGLYHNAGGNRAVDPQLGTGLDFWAIAADSYIKYKSSALWGTASYCSGHRRGVVWNESSDAGLIYPYFVADSIGGDIRMETYSFSGGYADHTDRWAWGITLAYEAGLHYRNVDPRPRNTTGKLDIAFGGAMRIASSRYQLGASANFRKYKQSADLEFVNEMSDTRIWHLTGLGTHYERFAGNGYTHYYDGSRWGASVDLFPDNRRGVVASVGVASFRFDHILTSLNELPLQSAAETSLDAMAGWLAPGQVHDWAATTAVAYVRRNGTENLFGDPASGVYPQIGSLGMYSRRRLSAELDLLWQWHPGGRYLLSVKPAMAYVRDQETYAEPRRSLLVSHIVPGVEVGFHRAVGDLWRAGFEASYECHVAVDNSAYLPFDSMNPIGLQALDTHRYSILSKGYSSLSFKAKAVRAISGKYALMLTAAYARESYTAGVFAHRMDAALSFVF